LIPAYSSYVVTQSESLPQLPFYLCQGCFDGFDFFDGDVVYPHIDPLIVDP
jgi:hypothetical protein